MRPCLEKPFTKKIKTNGVAQDVEPELKFQY
jgi:hypothetical protein